MKGTRFTIRVTIPTHTYEREVRIFGDTKWTTVTGGKSQLFTSLIESNCESWFPSRLNTYFNKERLSDVCKVTFYVFQVLLYKSRLTGHRPKPVNRYNSELLKRDLWENLDIRYSLEDETLFGLFSSEKRMTVFWFVWFCFWTRFFIFRRFSYRHQKLRLCKLSRPLKTFL